MKTKIFKWGGIAVALLAVLSVLYVLMNKSGDETKFVEIDPGFSEFVTAIPSGYISSSGTIKIVLAQTYENYESISADDVTDLFSFSPSISGNARFVDPRTIEFIPEERFTSGELYTASFELGDLIQAPEKFQSLEFNFQIIKQNFTVRSLGLTAEGSDNKSYTLQAVFTASDIIGNEDVEKIVTANLGGDAKTIEWSHGKGGKEHKFNIRNIQREEEAQELVIRWDGESIGVDNDGKFIEPIVALGDFKITKVTVIQLPEQFVRIEFSDVLEQNQDFRGMIKANSYTSFKPLVQSNILKVYPRAKLSGEKELTISAGIKSALGYKLKDDFSETIYFSEEKPAVEFIGKGTILPNSDGLIIPFKSVNLNAVDVTIIKIFEDNIPQFLQVNNLNGLRELKRVGRKVHKERVNLQSDEFIDYGQWNTFYIDLGKMIQADPGAIYRVKLSFKKAYSMYSCAEDDEDAVESLTDDWDEEDADDSYWDSDYYYGYQSYDWRNRDNPCHKAYYRDNRFPERNIIGSNFGIIAKTDPNNELSVFVTDIRTAMPLSGIDVDVLNYQQQVVGRGTTDGDGYVSIKPSTKPYLLVAKKNADRGYLRMNSGSSLSLSMFDIGGTEPQKGIKGFIYGERGVWRPGDTVHLTFILEDKDNRLPESHPVVLELKSPTGKVESRLVKTEGVGGFYYFKVLTDSEAETGNWQAEVKVGGASFQKQIKLETIKPNRLKINIDLKGKERLSVTEPINAGLNVKWLHGAVARNLKSTVNLTFRTSKTVFETFRDYTFDDPVSDFYPEEQVIFDGKVDNEGNATISASVDMNNEAPGMLKAHFITKAFEEGGNFSVDHFSVPFAPYKHFVGIKTPKGDKARGMLLTDEKHKIEIATVDHNGKPVSRNNLRLKVYKLRWRWWWHTSEENLASYVGSTYNQPIVDTRVSTVSGKGSYDFEIEYPEWGRYLVRVTDQDGHSTGKIVFVDWPGWAGRAQKEGGAGASMLQVSTDKQKYITGETAKLSIPATAKGRALVSVEKGAKILKQFWVDLSEKEQQVDINIEPQMAPNVFFNVMLLQPHKHEDNDLPIRLYGYTPVLVEDPETILKPRLKMPDELESEQTFTLSVSEENGKPMTYNIAIVDDGLLDLTRFKTPNPWPVFYAREALGIKTWDLYDDVIGAYGGKLEQVFAIGGDEDLNNKGKKSANRFKPVVQYLGPFTLSAGSSEEHTITLPKYVGSVRTMVIAGANGAYGSVDKTTPVKKPLMVLASLPRKLSPKEKLQLPVTVFAMDPSMKSVQLTVESNELLQFPTKTKTLSFAKTGEQDITFDLTVANAIGIGRVKVKATSGSYEADYEIEIDVLNPNEPITQVIDTVQEAGQSWNTDFTAPGVAGSNSAVLEVSSVPPIDLSKRLHYLMRYPHGCIEQTTSSVFPQLYLDKITDLTDNQIQDIERNIKQGIKRLASFQLSDGGLGYWPGAYSSSDWGTSYAGHFMLEAEKVGYELPAGFKSNWLNFQRTEAQNWTNTNRYGVMQQVYRLYTLALAGQPEFGAMNRIKESSSLNNQSKWRLAATYALAGQKEVAKEIISSATMDIEEYRDMSQTFGNSTRDKAMILEALLLLDKDTEAFMLLEQIAGQLSDCRWMNTQTTAYCLISVAKIVADQPGEVIYSYAFNNTESQSIETQLPISQVDAVLADEVSGKLSLTNESESVLYTRLAMTGIPMMGNETAFENNLNLAVDYLDTDGNYTMETETRQGDQVLIRVRVKNTGVTGTYENMALTIPVPSGWEIDNSRLMNLESSYQADVPDYIDIRDDRAHMYFDIKQGETKTFTMLCNISFLGEYYLPAISCEAMYDNKISAQKSGKWVRVND